MEILFFAVITVLATEKGYVVAIEPLFTDKSKETVVRGRFCAVETLELLSRASRIYKITCGRIVIYVS